MMLIKREVFQALADAHSEWKYRVQSMGNDGQMSPWSYLEQAGRTERSDGINQARPRGKPTMLAGQAWWRAW